jgi:hypothetical protein
MGVTRFLSVVLTILLLAGGVLAPGVGAQQSQPAVATASADREGAYSTGANLANVWYAPGRALVCGASVLVAAAIMTVTFGQSYDDAALFAQGGCGGPWLVKEADMRRALDERKSPDAP